jgi:DNA-binding PadR family transcriptional regulator
MQFRAQEGQHEKELYSGLIRLHILHHAAEEGIFGLGMIEELARHGYKLSPGTLYPVLHRLEEKGLLRSYEHIEAGKIRRVYRATAAGRKGLMLAKEKVRELFGELFEDEPILGMPKRQTSSQARKRK